MSYEVEFSYAIKKLNENRYKWLVIGLKSADESAIEGFKTWLTSQGIDFNHRTNRGDGKKLPYNGVLYVNPMRLGVSNKR